VRVRYLVIGAVRDLIVCNEHMIGKCSVGEIGKEMTVGDKVDLEMLWQDQEYENVNELEMRHV